MAAAESVAPGLRRDGAVLRVQGRLDRAAAAGLWPALREAAQAGVDTLDLSAVSALDSAGLALLAELSARIADAAGERPQVAGRPAGLAELCAAYRMDPDLDFAGTHR